ncbi:hypothetical protein [Haloarchaeobius sp. TZWWS8]|uniref:hypothetical protein n=1 Tax=Haloarchaeobius sp. TZWWS8 TaxID=3446121 RepID=UPI003EBA4F75
MTDLTGDQRLERIEQGLDALFATEVAKEILAAVDFEAILADEPATEPVDVDRLANAIGRPVGRLLAHYVVSGSGAGALAKRAIGSEVGGRVATETFRFAVRTVDFRSVAETLVELDEETIPGPALRELVEPHIDDGDVMAYDMESDATTGGDASDEVDISIDVVDADTGPDESADD